MKSYQEKIAAVGISASDAVQLAVEDDLKHLEVESLSYWEMTSLRMEVAKLVRQTVRARFLPKTHMDM